jgi:glucokinase
MTVLLAGDTGGTKTILRLVEAEASSTKPEPTLTTLHEHRYRSAEYPDLVPMVRSFLKAAEQETGRALLPEKACFAIAGPVVDNYSKLTNLGWTLDADRLSQELQISDVALINDFVAVGYGILGLEPADLHTLQVGKPDPDAPIGVIGAGTGLGEGFLIRHPTGYRVYGTEGGHTCFAPRNELEFQLLRYLIEKYHLTRVSVERVVSGMGIVALYQFLRDRQMAAESPELAEARHRWESEIGKAEKTVDLGAVIGSAALEKRDRLCELTLSLFVELYGTEAGNLALKLLPYGGLYVAGGIAPKILPLLIDGCFMQAFNDKGRMSPLMERVPVHVVLNPSVGLIGAALYAAQL